MLGKRFKLARESVGIKKQLFADRWKQCRVTLLLIESEKQIPKADTLRKYCQVLNVDASWLLGVKYQHISTPVPLVPGTRCVFLRTDGDTLEWKCPACQKRYVNPICPSCRCELEKRLAEKS